MLRPPEGKAGLLAAQWNEELPAWVDGMRSYAESLGRSAKVYESNDSAAERAFGGAPGQGHVKITGCVGIVTLGGKLRK